MENSDLEGVHWCNICSKMVNPITESENKCPFCETEFAEVIDNFRDQNDDVLDLRSAWVFSLYAPIFLGLMGAFSPSLTSIGSSSSSSRNFSREEEEEEIIEAQNQNEHFILGRRRRTTSSTYMMHLFRGLHVRMVSESEILPEENNRTNNNNNNNLENSSSILVIDPFNEGALIVRGPNLMNHNTSSSSNSPIPNHNHNHNHNNNNNNNNSVGSLNDFVVGSGFDLLLQHLAQIAPSTTGYASVNPPAQKAAIEAMPNVTSEEKMQCTVCLEDLEIGTEAKEMPCKHKFHSDCIISWLKLHSSCPVCRFQMPFEDSELNLGIGNNNHNGENQNNDPPRGREDRARNGRRNWFPVLQSFNNFLPSP